MRIFIPLYIVAFFLAAYLLGGAPAKERAPLPEALTATAHLEPPPLVIERPLADWDTVTPPAAPVFTFEVSATAPERVEYVEPEVIPTQSESRGIQVSYVPEPGAALNFDQLAPGSLTKLSWMAGETLHGAAIPTPVLVASGTKPGPTLCVTAAVHGDELNGIESVRELMYSINAEKLKGMLIGVPIVNLQGFQRHSRYLSDRRDLNRYFPGNPRGSVASRMAFSFFNDIVRRCDHLVDLHTGSFHRTNLPQLRANLQDEGVLALTQGFGSTTILHSEGGRGTLRRAAVDAGIPAVTLEAGEPLRLQEDAVEHTVKALFTLMDTLDMYPKRSLWGNPAPTYYSSTWVRADQGGMLFTRVKLGKRVREGDLLGTVTDPITSERTEILAPYPARVIGMAVNQFVMPGYATFHLAAETDLENPVEGGEDHESGLDFAISDTLGEERSE